jgi:hypothetical protein
MEVSMLLIRESNVSTPSEEATRQQGNKATRQQTEASYLVASTLIEVVLS